MVEFEAQSALLAVTTETFCGIATPVTVAGSGGVGFCGACVVAVLAGTALAPPPPHADNMQSIAANAAAFAVDRKEADLERK